MSNRKIGVAHVGIVLITSFLLTSCSTQQSAFHPDKKYSKAQLQSDITILEKILQHSHPGLYWYATQDSISGYFQALYSSLTDSLTEQQFRNRIAYAVSKIHCGHTVVRPSEKFVDYYTKHKPPQFPLSLKLWKDTAVVTQNLVKDDATLKRGTIVKSINGRLLTIIRDSIFQLIGTDGYADIFKYQALSNNFSAFYRNAFGTDSQYVIQYIDSTGYAREKILKNYFPQSETTIKLQYPNSLTQRQRKQLEVQGRRNLYIDTILRTAFRSVNTFSEGKLKRFFRKSFRTIEQQKPANLVVDVRVNAGGDVLACTTLLQYLTNKPFRIADTIVANSRSFIYKKQIRPWFIYWFSMLVSGKRSGDGKIHFRHFERQVFKPMQHNHFNGNIYLLTGGYTFSAASMFAGQLKGQDNVVIVGEETGGGYYGNSAMFLTNILLPNTGIRVVLPLYKMVWDSTRQKNGRGVFPDVQVQPTARQLKLGIDAKIEMVKELINRNKNSPSGNVAKPLHIQP